MSVRDLIARMTLICAFCFYLFLGLALPAHGQAGEYYIYQDPNGKLVISNRQPPPGSKIIKQQNLPEEIDSQPAEEPDDKQMNGNNDRPLKQFKNK
jgi:hypothetical protein